MQPAGNRLNVAVIDACRDNPSGWNRCGTRGFSAVSSQPPGSIIAYATSAGSVSQDGTGRIGVFTAELLRYNTEPEIDNVPRPSARCVKRFWCSGGTFEMARPIGGYDNERPVHAVRVNSF